MKTNLIGRSHAHGSRHSEEVVNIYQGCMKRIFFSWRYLISHPRDKVDDPSIRIRIARTIESFVSGGGEFLMVVSERLPLLRSQPDVRPFLLHEFDGLFGGVAVLLHQVAADQGGAAGTAGLAMDVDGSSGGVGFVGDLPDELDSLLELALAGAGEHVGGWQLEELDSQRRPLRTQVGKGLQLVVFVHRHHSRQMILIHYLLGVLSSEWQRSQDDPLVYSAPPWSRPQLLHGHVKGQSRQKRHPCQHVVHPHLCLRTSLMKLNFSSIAGT